MLLTNVILTILTPYYQPNIRKNIYIRHNTVSTDSGVRVIATRILHEISLLIGELAIRGTKLTLNNTYFLSWEQKISC